MTVSLSGMTLLTNNDSEGNWAGTDGADTYNVAEQGTNSESWNVAKNSSETGTLTLSAALSAVRGLVMFWMKSDVSYYYTNIFAELESTASNLKNFTCAAAANPAISGDFKPIVLDYVNKGAETGTYAPASHAVMRINVDNSSSGNIRSVINNWIDAIYYGVGLAIAGTTVGDKCFTEAFDVNNLVANKYGMLSQKGSIIFSQGDVAFNGTALTSEGETLEFIDTDNGYDRYNCDGSGTLTLINSNIQASGTVDYDLDMSSMTAFSMTGGAIKQCNQLTLIAGQTLSGVVLTDVNLSSIANAPTGCTWNLSGQITVTGTITNWISNESTVADNVGALVVDDLAKLITGEAISSGTGHAVELTSIGGGSMTTDSKFTGYDAGVAGSPITPTATGKEAIFVSAASGTVTINVAAGATVPSIRSAGAAVNVVAGSVDLSITVKDDQSLALLENVQTSIHLKDAPFTALMNEDTNALGLATEAYSGALPVDVVWKCRKSETTDNPRYFAKSGIAEIDAGGLNVTALLKQNPFLT